MPKIAQVLPDLGNAHVGEINDRYTLSGLHLLGLLSFPSPPFSLMDLQVIQNANTRVRSTQGVITLVPTVL